MSLLTPEELEQSLAALTGQRITPEYIEGRIIDRTYMIIPGTTTTICNISLDNGFSVRGESACVDKANFNPDIGETYAHKAAFDKLWPLFGFLLAESMFVKEGA